MDELTFQKKYLPKIKAVLKFALENDQSDFYRKKYKGKVNPEKIKSYKDFAAIPFLTKEELLATPVSDRLFIPKERITHYNFTSGTTNQQKVLVMPHARPEKEIEEVKYVFSEERLKKAGAKNFLILLPPLAGAATMVRKVPKNYIADIFGDISNLRKTALIAKEVGVDSIVSTATITYLFIQELKKIDFDPRKVKWIWLLGEHCGKEKFEILKNYFPNATFNLTYGAAESTSGLTVRGYNCDYLDRENRALYHTMPVFLFETVDDFGSPTKKGGGIIQTDLVSEKAFPLIRYKTGDFGLLSEIKCQCGNENVVELLGREKYDVLKFYGTILYSHLISRSLESFQEDLEPFFEMHVYEKRTEEDKLMPLLLLRLTPRDQKGKVKELIEQIKIEVGEKLILGINKNLNYFIENKLFHPLEIEFVEDGSLIKKDKAKTIISHLN